MNHWITDKIRLDLDEDIYNYVDINEMKNFDGKKAPAKQEKFDLMHYLQQTDENQNITTGMLHISGLDYDKYDETYIAKDIVNEMMKKRLVNTKDLLQKDQNAKKFDDLKAKIDMRHQKVKENRDKRTKDVENKRKENLIKKEAEIHAKEMIKREENDKRMRLQLEQQLLEQETDRLRKEIANKRHQEELVKQKLNFFQVDISASVFKIHLYRQREYELNQIEKEKKENLVQQKLMEHFVSEYAVDIKRKEMQEKRSEELVLTYIRAKNMRVSEIFLQTQSIKFG